MITAYRTLRLVLVGVLALSLSFAPYCPKSMGSDCPAAQSQQHSQHGHSVPGRCCCGGNCHCINCPAAHGQQQQNKKESPVSQTDGRDLAKIASAVGYSLISATEKSASVACSPELVGECVHLQTLISQHTCLRV